MIIAGGEDDAKMVDMPGAPLVSNQSVLPKDWDSAIEGMEHLILNSNAEECEWNSSTLESSKSTDDEAADKKGWQAPSILKNNSTPPSKCDNYDPPLHQNKGPNTHGQPIFSRSTSWLGQCRVQSERAGDFTESTRVCLIEHIDCQLLSDCWTPT
jgi:hypothetical protein